MIRPIILILFTILLHITTHAQHVNVNIIEGFNSGNPTLIEPYLAEEVEFIDPNNEGIYGKATTNKKLSEFFTKNNSKDFSIKHHGNSPGNDHYCIGILNTNKGVFRVYLLYVGEEKTKISEIRIEEDE